MPRAGGDRGGLTIPESGLTGPDGLNENTGKTAGVEPLLASILSAIPPIELPSTEELGRRPVALEIEAGAEDDGDLGPRAGKTKSGRRGLRSGLEREAAILEDESRTAADDQRLG